MKLLIDARVMGSNPSGVGIYIYNYIRALGCYPDVEMVLLSDVAISEHMATVAAMPRVRVLTYGKPVLKSAAVYGYFRFVQKAIDAEAPDIFWEPNNLVPVPVKNPTGKVIITIHDVFPMSMPACFSRLYQLYFRLGIRVSLGCGDAILYVSKETKDETARFFAKASRVPYLICYDIVELEMELAQANCKERGKLPEGAFLYIGNLERRKGTDILLKAYAAYVAKGGKKSLRLAGRVREAEIEELLAQVTKEVEAADGPQLTYLGYISEEQKVKEYATCHTFVFPSRAEGFGMPVMEALFFEKPMILSNIGIFRELFEGVGTMFCLGGDDAVNVRAKEKEAMAAAGHAVTGQDSVDNLAWAMLEAERGEGKPTAKEVLRRYSAETLGAAIYAYFESLLA